MEMHPQVAAILQQAQRLQAAMDEQLAKMNTDTFTATDEARTVEVTVNGHHWLTDVFIEDGLLRLGAQIVESRINEALANASEQAAATIQIDRERLHELVAEITGPGR